MGKGGGGDTAASKSLAGFINDLKAASGPTRRLGFKQSEEALRTGGIGARIPIIQRAVEASKTATGNALKQTREEGAASGLAGTPFLENILATQRQAGATTAANIPTTIAQDFISQGFPASVQSGSTAISGLSSLSAGQQAQQAAAESAQGAEIGGGAAAVGGIIAAIIIA